MRVKLLVLLVVLSVLLANPIIAVLKSVLIVSEQFPQIPIKPLHVLTITPKHEYVRVNQEIVGDLYLSNHFGKKPALILAMGVRTNEKDKPTLLGFAQNLARLGYVVMWPRQEALDKETIKFEKPDTFIESFKYLEQRKEVERKRISFVGFSVGSSIALVAAQNPAIAERVYSLVFFGGYYNAIDYLTSLFSASYFENSQKVSWRPDESGLNHASAILESVGIEKDKFKKPEALERLLSYSPDQNLQNFKASIFILHEKADNFVPFVESVKLNEALDKLGKEPKAFHITNLFEHVQPKEGFSLELIKEFAGLFGFLYKVFMFL